jgi:NAD(P)-dependent dehydrogenase (short-subunit alcohol dehydrogenase family)
LAIIKPGLKGESNFHRDFMKRAYPLAAVLAALATATWIAKSRKRVQLENRVVIISGGSRGLGFVLARELLRKGNRVVLLARDGDELDRACKKLGETQNILAISCDITNKNQVKDAIDQIESNFGRIDVLINNAGTIVVGPMNSMTEDDYRKSLDISFWGSFNTIQAVLPKMRTRSFGRIVNISSIGGKISVPHLLPYCVGKFALAGFSEGLHSELKRENILVTTIYPGLMRTGSPRNATFKSKHRQEYTWFSLSDSLPGISMSGRRAARQIIGACESGRARRVLSFPAKVAVKANEFVPELVASVLAGANRLLPRQGGIGPESALGKDSHSFLSPSAVTTLGERAAIKNNEVA